MGMYNYLNGEQIKFFYVPVIGMPDFVDPDTCLHFMGGELNDYDVGSEVPWKTLWYNFGKDFNILDLFPYDHEESMIHIIRDGKNSGFVYLSQANDDLFKIKTYDSRGSLTNITSLNEVLELKKRKEELQDALKRIWVNEPLNEVAQRSREVSKEEKETPEFKEWMNNKLEEARKTTDENTLKMIPYRKAVADFFVSVNEKEDLYETFGGLIERTEKLGINLIKKDGKFDFVVNDERLLYLVACEEIKALYNSSETFLEDYMNALDMDLQMRNEVKKSLANIISMEEEVRKFKMTKDMFFENYALRDILNGRHKEHYKKIGILPYEDFDVSIWEEKQEE